jgi:hypothetical protein
MAALPLVVLVSFAVAEKTRSCLRYYIRKICNRFMTGVLALSSEKIGRFNVLFLPRSSRRGQTFFFFYSIGWHYAAMMKSLHLEKQGLMEK